MRYLIVAITAIAILFIVVLFQARKCMYEGYIDNSQYRSDAEPSKDKDFLPISVVQQDYMPRTEVEANYIRRDAIPCWGCNLSQ